VAAAGTALVGAFRTFLAALIVLAMMFMAVGFVICDRGVRGEGSQSSGYAAQGSENLTSVHCGFL
jgi:hypothetical protein